MSEQGKNTTPAPPILILAGSSSQYTDARRRLDLSPGQASWLTRAANLTGRQRPKVFRFGDWKSLPNIKEIEAALAATQAEVSDL